MRKAQAQYDRVYTQKQELDRKRMASLQTTLQGKDRVLVPSILTS